MKHVPQQPNKPNIALGKKGEDIACSMLRRLGYNILDRNWQRRYGELDIVALDGETLVVVEVKTRIGTRYGLPEEAVTSRKLRELINTTHYYKLSHEDLPDALRIDVVALILDEHGTVVYQNHIMNVTG